MCGVYPDASLLGAGEEISSTYEGRHVTLLASELTHAGAVVTKGLPVVFGGAVGIALDTEVLGTDKLIAVDTEGIWKVSVVAQTLDGDSAVVPGDRLYISTDACVVSKRKYPPYNILFGYALGNIDGGLTRVIAVKVHQDPDELVVIGGVTYFGSMNIGGPITAGSSLGVAGATTLNGPVVCIGSLAIGGPLTMHQVVNALELPAADPNIVGRLWVNAGVVTRSAG